MADLRSSRRKPTSLRHVPVPRPPAERPPRPRVTRPPRAEPVEVDPAELSPAFRTLQWAALATIVMAAVWLMFGTPAIDLAEAPASAETATQ